MPVDLPGFVTDLKEHATEHGFHVHDERHFVETYSLRQSWEVDVHPEAGCGRPIDLHLALDVDPRVVLALDDYLNTLDEEFVEPEGAYDLDMYFNWAIPPLQTPPDLLVLATDLAGIGSTTLPIEITAIDSYDAVTDAAVRRLTVMGKVGLSLVDVVTGRDELCEVLEAAREVSEYLLDRVDGWMEIPG